jgi:hypothetical protein
MVEEFPAEGRLGCCDSGLEASAVTNAVNSPVLFNLLFVNLEDFVEGQE